MTLSQVLATLFVRFRWVVWVLTLAVTALAILGHAGRSMSMRLGEDNESAADQEAREYLSEITDQFSLQFIEALLVLDADDLFTPANVRAVRAAQSAVNDLPQVDQILWLDDVPTLNVFGLPEPLLPDADSSVQAHEAAKRRCLENPLVVGQMISPDGTTAVMPIAFDWVNACVDMPVGLSEKEAKDFQDDAVSRRISEAAREAIAEVEGDVRARVTGTVPIFVEIERSFERNNFRYRMISYVLVATLSIILFRGFSAVVIAGAAPAMGILWATGLLNFFEVERNSLASIMMPVLIVMVGMTDGIHLIIHLRRSRAAGLSPQDAARDGLAAIGPACAMTSLTTAIGFGSLLMARSEFIRDFGVSCGLAVVITFFAVITVIPLLSMTWLGKNLHLGQERDFVGNALQRNLGRFERFLRHAKFTSWLGIALLVALFCVSLTLRPDARTQEQLPSRTEAAQALAHCDQKIGGIDFARVVIEWPENLPDDSPRILAAVERAEEIVRTEPILANPLSIRNMIQSLAPKDANLGERMSLLQLMPPPLLDVLFSAESRRTLISMRVQDLGVAKYYPAFQRIEEQLLSLQDEFPGFHFAVTGSPVVEGEELSRIVYDLAASLGTACVVIFIVMTIAYRSLRLGLISVVPNLLPLVMTGALLVLTGNALTFTSVCAFTVCIGIAVDDTIHFLTRFGQEAAAGQSPTDALRESFLSVGNALVTTTLVLVAGFGTVLFSELPSQRMFAQMACCTIAAALLADLIFLPAMLKYFGAGTGHAERRPRQLQRAASPE